MKAPIARTLTRLLAAALLLAAAGCSADFWRLLDIDDLLDDEPTPTTIQPDSVRGDTTFYSYLFRMPMCFSTARPSVIAKVEGGVWILPKKVWLGYGDNQALVDMALQNQFMLTVVQSSDPIQQAEMKGRAYLAIAAAGAEIMGEPYPGPCDAHFTVRYPVPGTDTPSWRDEIPAEIDILDFIRALDDPEVFSVCGPMLDFPMARRASDM